MKMLKWIKVVTDSSIMKYLAMGMLRA